MKTLVVLNRNPYDGTDVTWNALRLAENLLDAGAGPRIFLMNDSIDPAKAGGYASRGILRSAGDYLWTHREGSHGQGMWRLPGELRHSQEQAPD